MSNAALLSIIGGPILFLALLIAALHRHKKSAARQCQVLGASGSIAEQLDPEGAVIVNGELWRARLNSGSVLSGPTRVRVIGTHGHLLIVEPDPN